MFDVGAPRGIGCSVYLRIERIVERGNWIAPGRFASLIRGMPLAIILNACACDVDDRQNTVGVFQRVCPGEVGTERVSANELALGHERCAQALQVRKQGLQIVRRRHRGSTTPAWVEAIDLHQVVHHGRDGTQVIAQPGSTSAEH